LSFPYLKHPLVIGALILTFLNDHFLKHQFHNFLTGKISDFTGIFYFPLFIYALCVFIKSPLVRHNYINKTGLLICILVTDVLFLAFKYTEARVWLSEVFNNYFFKIEIVPDVTDISALSMNAATYFFSLNYLNESD
jgi:hypothetical protein